MESSITLLIALPIASVRVPGCNALALATAGRLPTGAPSTSISGLIATAIRCPRTGHRCFRESCNSQVYFGDLCLRELRKQMGRTNYSAKCSRVSRLFHETQPESSEKLLP